VEEKSSSRRSVERQLAEELKNEKLLLSFPSLGNVDLVFNRAHNLTLFVAQDVRLLRTLEKGLLINTGRL